MRFPLSSLANSQIATRNGILKLQNGLIAAEEGGYIFGRITERTRKLENIRCSPKRGKTAELLRILNEFRLPILWITQCSWNSSSSDVSARSECRAIDWYVSLGPYLQLPVTWATFTTQIMPLTSTTVPVWVQMIDGRKYCLAPDGSSTPCNNTEDQIFGHPRHCLDAQTHPNPLDKFENPLQCDQCIIES